MAEDPNRLRIIQEAGELFNARGYRSVTISDLADRLGMSKKTIYLYFSSKDEIAAAVVEIAVQRITDKIRSADTSLEPLDVLRTTVGQIKSEVLRISPIFLADIQKYLPNLWQYIARYRGENIVRFLQHWIEEAQKAGMAKDLNPRLVSLIFMESVQALVRPDALAKYGFTASEVIDTLIEILVGGISVPESGEPDAP